MRKYVLNKIEMAMVCHFHNGNIRHCAWSALRPVGIPPIRPAVVGIRPLLGSFHWSAFRRSAFGHAPQFLADCTACSRISTDIMLSSVCPWSACRSVIWLIIGSDRRSETKQGKIVRFRSCLRHFRFIISCRRHFVRFVLNFTHINTEKRSDLTFVNECTN